MIEYVVGAVVCVIALLSVAATILILACLPSVLGGWR